jgi:alpha-tubulin suppressor-like RCC1 family protein
VVFSEPIDGTTVSPTSIQLFRGSTSIAGTVRVLPGAGDLVAFTPTAPLASNADYELVVRRTIRDLQGDALPNDGSTTFRTGQGSLGAPASLIISPDTVYLTGYTYQMSALVQDSAGNILIDVPVTWSTNDSSGLTISPSGLITVLAEGVYGVKAEAAGLTAFADVVATLPTPAASISLSPTSDTIPPGGGISLTPTVRDASGRVIQREVTWASSNTAVATVVGGEVTGVTTGVATISATSGPANASATITVIPPPLLPLHGVIQMAAGDAHTCALDAAGLAYCWGWNYSGQLGDGTDFDRSIPGFVAGSHTFTSLTAGQFKTCGVATGGSAYCWAWDASLTPTLVGAGISFTQLDFGGGNDEIHACGISAAGAAYCWGSNGHGQLGDGTKFSRQNPAPVAGGLQFQLVTTGGLRSCGLTLAGVAYCWGGTLGGTSSLVPAPAAPGIVFTSLTAAGDHICGVAVGGSGYCWGDNGDGELGDGTTTAHQSPTPVSGGHVFSIISTGSYSTCGLDVAGAAYCWGDNLSGQLGSGSIAARSEVPTPVSGAFTFQSITVGRLHACAVTTGGIAYCWGANGNGQLGDGTKVDRSIPRRVVGQQ